MVEDDDDALARALRTHVQEHHPEDERTDDEIRERVGAEGYEPPDRPPWVY